MPKKAVVAPNQTPLLAGNQAVQAVTTSTPKVPANVTAANPAGTNAYFQRKMVRDKVRNRYKHRMRNAGWSLLDSKIVDDLSEQEVLQKYIPRPSTFSGRKLWRRNIYIFFTLNGSIVNWYYSFQESVRIAFVGIFVVTLSTTIQVNGKRIIRLGTETFLQA